MFIEEFRDIVERYRRSVVANVSNCLLSIKQEFIELVTLALIVNLVIHLVYISYMIYR